MTTDSNIVEGTIEVRLIDVEGNVTHEETLKNLITDNGDLYQASRIATGINANTVAAPTPVNGMKLGTGITAASKNGAGAVLATYLAASNIALDAGYPQVVSLCAGLGVNVVYRVTWPAGTATSTTINEVAIVTDAATDANSAENAVIARGVFGTTINKAAGEALEVTWNHKQLGA